MVKSKDLLPLIDENVRLYTEEIVSKALKNLNLKKATSWDFIHGICYEAILENPKIISSIN
jgi:hypothetical protein